MLKDWIVVVLVILVLVPAAVAQESGGRQPIELSVNATEVSRGLIHARLVLPVGPGSLTLLYPKWIPGEHGPTGPVTDLAGLKIDAGGNAIPWRRDELDMYAIHCDVPLGIKEIEVSLDYLASPSASSGFGTSAASATSQLAIISWNQVLLYPKGQPANRIQFRASLELPENWKLGTALPTESREGRRTQFAAVSLVTLIDSPVLCGKHFREVKIGDSEKVPHFIELAGDSEEALDFPAEWKESCDRLVAETEALFGGRPYKDYRFLLSLSDHIAHFGLEHHRSSDNRVAESALIDEKLRLSWMGTLLLPHEFVHAWNGKYRRPKDMVTRDFNEPQRTKLLWVYEGLTTYLHLVLTTRSGFWTLEQGVDAFAEVVEQMQNQKGRTWRPLEDTAVSTQLLFHAREDWRSWRRSADFYGEGALIWLEIDAIIREKTDGRLSLDDFCRKFFASGADSPRVSPYTLEDVVVALDAMAPHDWSSLIKTRLETLGSEPPLDGIRRSGWRPVYTKDLSDIKEAAQAATKSIDLSSSVGFRIGEDGTVIDVIPGKAADRAGVDPKQKIVAVNSMAFSPARLHRAISSTMKGRPLEILTVKADYFSSFVLDYQEGPKYLRLERIPSTDDLLARILKPVTSPVSE